MNEINKNIMLWRRERKLRQRDVADALGMKHSTYSQMEREGNIRADVALKIAEILNVANEKILGVELPKKTTETTGGNGNGENEDDDTIKKTEMNLIKIFRNLDKNDKNEIIMLFNQKYHENK